MADAASHSSVVEEADSRVLAAQLTPISPWFLWFEFEWFGFVVVTASDPVIGERGLGPMAPPVLTLT